ncbi:(2Fe-2S)-binding protein [Jeotgalibacillus proteolyticus]|uniref:(2Fe-2S)-binding protein n=1 Tax=Jeotgalibacillus proteolyticus TaxID=2082395 RepID=UPI003CED5DDF
MTQDELKHFISENIAISFGEPDGQNWTLSSWSSAQTATRDFEAIQAIQQAPKLNVTGSLVMKRAAFAYLGALLAFYKEGEVWDLQESSIHLVKSDDPLFFYIKLQASQITVSSVRLTSEQWDEAVKVQFHDWLKPLVSTISDACKIHEIILWENVFIYLKWFYEALAPSLSELGRHDWESQWNELTSESFFGEETLNPFAYLSAVKSKRVMDNGMRVRHTCCYKHKLPGGTKCSTCSQIKAT